MTNERSVFWGVLLNLVFIMSVAHATVDLPTAGITLSAPDEDNRLISGRAKNIGDFNNDGYDDFMIGVYYNSEGGSHAGKIYLYYGSATRLADGDLTDADAAFIGSEGRIAGSDLSGDADINNDGCADVLIGAEGIYLTSSAIDGRVYLLYGRGTGCASTTAYSGDYTLDSSADAIFTGKTSGDYAGTGVAVAQDVNGDGYDDIVIGADGNDDSYSNAGITYLIYGKSSQFSGTINLKRVDTVTTVTMGTSPYAVTLTMPAISGIMIKGAATNDYSGISVASAGDVNNDGYGDILIAKTGGGSGPSQVYLIRGSSSLASMSLSSANANYTPEANLDYAIDLPDNHGDLNNDGCDDIVIGASKYDNSGTDTDDGRVYVVYGTTETSSGITSSIKNIGDVKSTSIIKKCSAGSPVKNRALSSADVIYTGESSYYEAGDSLSFAADTNGDGYDDLLIGAPMDRSEVTPGRTYLIYGSRSLASASLSTADIIFTDDAWYHNGRSVAGGGDYDGDGVPDLLVIVSGSDHSTSSSYGAAYVVYDY